MSRPEIKAGLRVDADTLRGTLLGVANLLALFHRHDIRATFFFSVGPDNMGRHLLRLLRPGFFDKMMRTGAVRLYGWDILFKGTLWPGPVIGKRAARIIGKAGRAGHEIGFHAWDHHRWQSRIHAMGREEIRATTNRGLKLLAGITGKPIRCLAAPAWKITAAALADRMRRDLDYCSDCRGHSLFYPRMNGRTYAPLQVPTTLPTYDELIGRKNIGPANYNDYLLGLFAPDKLNVLTIHAEAEGIACFDLFQEFVQKAGDAGIRFRPLGTFIRNKKNIGSSPLCRGEVPGRDGWVSCQGY